jgi:hypothetical protein
MERMSLKHGVKRMGEEENPMGEYECEFGSLHPVRFLSREQVTIYDSEGNEITPKCSLCGSEEGITTLCFKTTQMNLCSNCAYPDVEPLFIVWDPKKEDEHREDDVRLGDA